MKLILTIVVGVILFVSNQLFAQQQIIVHIKKIPSDKGVVRVGLYNKANFRLQSLQSAVGKITDGRSAVVFKNVNPGEYAVLCYQDANENQKMDFLPNGMPLENYGASNNSMSYGPPRYENAKFTVADKNIVLEVRL